MFCAVFSFAQQNREQYMIDSLLKVVKDRETKIVQAEEIQTTDDVHQFSAEDLRKFEEDARKNLEELYFQINVIAYKNNSEDKKNTAIATAMRLFSSEENTVEIRSVINPQKPTYFRKVRTYLNKLKLLAYKNVTFTTFETKISDKLTLGVDGNYYGTISFCQRFQYEPQSKSIKVVESEYAGMKDETTCKKIQIMVKHDTSFGEDIWRVFFGDMTVDELN